MNYSLLACEYQLEFVCGEVIFVQLFCFSFLEITVYEEYGTLGVEKLGRWQS